MFLCKPVIMIDFWKGRLLRFDKSGMVEIIKSESEFEKSYENFKGKTFSEEEVKHRLKFYIEYFGRDSSKFIGDKIMEKL